MERITAYWGCNVFPDSLHWKKGRGGRKNITLLFLDCRSDEL